jgi:hypothetical protein
MRVAAVILLLCVGACSGKTETNAEASAASSSSNVDADPMSSPATAQAQALADSLLPRLVRLSGLPSKGPLRLRSQTQAQVRTYVQSRLAKEMPPEEVAGVHDTYALLGLIPDTLDLKALLLDLYTEQVIGYYDPASRTMYVLSGADPDVLRPVLAHELVHALQDEHESVDSLIAPSRGNDRSNAAHTALEGHATLVMFAVLAEDAVGGQHVDPASLPNPAEQLRSGLEAQNTQFPVFARAPAVIRETLMFPYIAGADFVYRLWSADKGKPHRAPMDVLLPQSTEQLMHPQSKFIAQRDSPTELRFSAPAAAAQVSKDTTWRVTRDETMAELETAIFLEHYLGKPGRSIAEGWDGDRYQLAKDKQNNKALTWYSVWDDAASADRFANAIKKIATQRPTRTMTAERLVLQGRPAVRVIDVAYKTKAPNATTPGIITQN